MASLPLLRTHFREYFAFQGHFLRFFIDITIYFNWLIWLDFISQCPLLIAEGQVQLPV